MLIGPQNLEYNCQDTNKIQTNISNKKDVEICLNITKYLLFMKNHL